METKEIELRSGVVKEQVIHGKVETEIRKVSSVL